jgi:hypothetical protein
MLFLIQSVVVLVEASMLSCARSDGNFTVRISFTQKSSCSLRASLDAQLTFIYARRVLSSAIG